MKQFWVILIVALFLRVVYLNTTPPGVANDELNIAINAASILKTGSNIPGVVTGIIGKNSGDLSFGIHSEISSYLILPFIAILGLNLISIKIPFILASLGIVILGFLISKKLFNEKIAVITMAVFAFNPWLIFFGRTEYESILSTFFFLLSVFFILNFQGWKKVTAILPLIAGFLCYFSAKTLAVPISITTSVASLMLNKRRDYKPLLTLNILAIILVVGYYFALTNSPSGARIRELKSNSIAQSVNVKRTAILDNPFTFVFENKIIEESRIRLKAALSEFELNYLFFNGQPENIPTLTIPDHGFMYLIDLPLIILGIIYMVRGYKKQLVILSTLLMVTMIPNFLNLQGTTFSIRTVILFPILAILSSVGFFSIKIKYVKWLVVVIYIGFIVNFCYIYFYRLPIQSSEAWFLSQRVVSKYVTEISKRNPNINILLITSEPKLTYYKYIFYSNNYNNINDIKAINHKLENKDYSLNNITITSDCKTNNLKNTIVIHDSSQKCKGFNLEASIKSITDSGDIFFISNDLLCNTYNLNKYPLIKNRKLLNIEKLSTEDFCKNYIIGLL